MTIGYPFNIHTAIIIVKLSKNPNPINGSEFIATTDFYFGEKTCNTIITNSHGIVFWTSNQLEHHIGKKEMIYKYDSKL